MIQTPQSGDFLLKWHGDVLHVELHLDRPRKGRAALRTNLGNAGVRRQEIIDETERGITPLAKAWSDIPLIESAPGCFSVDVVLDQVGVFSGKTYFCAEGSDELIWAEGKNFHIKVESAETRANNSIYCVFPRQFGSFREVARRLDHIMGHMGFRILQTLPPFPVPTTYAVMGKYGCPFAATDFFSVDPSLAEFDESSTPLMQFTELIGAVHARQGLMLVDLPANHTGWGSVLQTQHPEWFKREPDGRFHSPGAWGVKWADLVELDYQNAELRTYMAEVFLYWCRLGIDGFRCDAGYMIPAETWEYIVAKVREEYPDTIFMLEGLGGDLAVTDKLLAESNLDWAYSEIFQTYDRGQFEWYLPNAISRSERYGALVHFAETHDNDRLAKNGEIYARLRVQLAALLSWQGAWGIANGVEWYCREKIDVHDRNDLNWGAQDNMVELIASLNRLLATNPTFTGACHLELITRGSGNTLAVLRTSESGAKLLVLANLDCGNRTWIDWDRARFSDVGGPVELSPGEVKWFEGGSIKPVEAKPSASLPKALFHIVMPRDVGRQIVVPEGQMVEVCSANRFRMRLIDPETGKTLRVQRSVNGRAYFQSPTYSGNGTRCRQLWLDMTLYDNGAATRFRAFFMIPPPADMASARLTISGEEIRQHPEYRTILSNGSGASAQIRLGWGTINSQYDAFLAANPNPTCPSDRQVLWTRTRAWLQCEGYVREFDARCVSSFIADPAGRSAIWNFSMPCGMGKSVNIRFSVLLVEGKNAAVLKAERLDGAEDMGGRVRIVFRPDVENRSFHTTTKAYQVEKSFACPLKFTLRNCKMHEDGQWTYNVSHSEEAARGQEPSGDLFSPGWISADLVAGEACEIRGEWK